MQNKVIKLGKGLYLYKGLRIKCNYAVYKKNGEFTKWFTDAVAKVESKRNVVSTLNEFTLNTNKKAIKRPTFNKDKFVIKEEYLHKKPSYNNRIMNIFSV